MIFVLDTNVASALMAPSRAPREVMTWLAARPLHSLFTTTISQAEVFAGLSVLPAGRHRSSLTELARGVFIEDFEGRVLTFDVAAALEYAAVFAARRRAGRPPSMADTMIAAIARAHDAIVVTRNVRDFDGCGVEVINPWDAPAT